MIYINELPPHLARLSENKKEPPAKDSDFESQLRSFLDSISKKVSDNKDSCQISDTILINNDIEIKDCGSVLKKDLDQIEETVIKVGEGDTLSQIAENLLKDNGISYNYSDIRSLYMNIASYNNIHNPDNISPDMKLIIPKDIINIREELNFTRPYIKMNHIENLVKERISIGSLLENYSRISSDFGYRIDPINHQKRFHNGIDIAAKEGTPITAPVDGVIIESGFNGGYGNYLKLICNNGFEWRFAHLKNIEVESGYKINRGDKLGSVGMTGRATGPHLHLEIREQGIPFDPLAILNI